MIDSAPDSVLPPPSDTHLKEFEAYYGIVLPADYRAFLTHCNGAAYHCVGISCWGRTRGASSASCPSWMTPLGTPNTAGPMWR